MYLGQLKNPKSLNIRGVAKTKKVDIVGIVRVTKDKLNSEIISFTRTLTSLTAIFINNFI
jgi:hypothetical protein